MKDGKKTKEQLVNELAQLRRQLTQLKAVETEQKKIRKDLQIAKDTYQRIVDDLPDLVCRYKPDTTITFVNEAYAKYFSKSTEELIGTSFMKLIPQKSHEDVLKTIESLNKKSPEITMEHLVLTADGQMRWQLWCDRALFDSSENVIEIQSIGKDITERKRAEESLKDSEGRYRSLVESSDDSIYLVDRNCKYIFMNDKHRLRMGFSGNEFLNREYSEFHSLDDTKWFVETVNKVFETGESIHNEHESLKDGRYFLLTLSPVKAEDGGIVAVTIISKDITELKLLEKKLHTLSITDELTGLYNRRGFVTLAEQHLKFVSRQKTGIFMLYIDLNNLKKINDTWGHKEGDLALIETAKLIKESYRESDIIARIGGDEFVVMPVGTTNDSVEIITARLQEAIEIQNAKTISSYNLSMSFGIAYYDPENPCSLTELLSQADKMMYKHKKDKSTS